MQTRTIDTLAEFSSMRAEWNALLDRSRFSSPFLAHEWVEEWWTRYAGQRDAMRVVCCYGADSVLRGVLPTYVQRGSGLLPVRRLRFLSDDLGATQLDCLVDPDAQDEVVSVLLDALAAGPGDWDVLDLRRMNVASPFRTRLVERFSSGGKRVAESVSVQCPVVTLPADWDAYLAMLSKRERGRMRRLRRELEALGTVVTEWIDDPAALPAAIDDAMRMFEQGMSRRHDDDFSVTERYRSFLTAVSAAFLAAGRLRFQFLVMSGERIAFVYQIRHGDTMYAYQTAYDESWAPQHVGFVVFGYAIENALTEGCARFNFGVGVGAYKLRFAPEVVDQHGVRFYRSSPRGALASARDRSVAWGKRTVKRLTPDGVSQRLANVLSRRGLKRL